MGLAGLGSIASSLTSMGSAVSQKIEHKLVPDSSQGLGNGGDISTADNKNTFYFYKHCIKREFAEKIDNFFDMFGYQVNISEVPNLYTRRNWNYLKVLEPNIEGTIIPEKDLDKFKTQLNAGITFWHNYQTFRDYSQSNPNV